MENDIENTGSDIRPKGKASGLLPILVFIILFAGTGILSGDFYAMPAIVAFMGALIAAFIQNRGKSFDEKLSVVTKGAGEENIITMCLIFILAGAFSGAVRAAGGADSAVSLGLSVLPSNIVVVGVFIIGCFISVSMGTSVGTIAALTPIASGIAETTGMSLPLCVGAVVCGAMFGDNLSMISDTTIAAVRTQGCEMKDKFKENFLIVLPAAVITIVLLYMRTRNISYILDEDWTYSIVQVVPYIVVLAGALLGMNVFALLILGTLLSFGAGLVTGSASLFEMFKAVGSGIEGMYEITVLSIIVAGVFALIKDNGGIDFTLSFIRSKIKGRKGAKLGIAALSSAVDMCTANNTVAIVITGPIAKDISEEYGISARTTASLLDIFTSVFQGIIPYGAQLLTAASIAGLTPFDIMPFLYYPVLMGVSGLGYILFKREGKVTKED